MFWCDGLPGRRARTLRNFVTIIEHTGTQSWRVICVDGIFLAGLPKFSGDYPLAHTVRNVEDSYHANKLADVSGRLSKSGPLTI